MLVGQIMQDGAGLGQDPAVILDQGRNRARRVDGEKLGRANADFVRESTGYAIGGVSPLGHANPVRLVLDQDLQRFAQTWAAAGTPFSVFPLSPAQLIMLTGADWADIRQEPVA